jgi:glycosyltransferase involved in cell wall biosynthesis
MRIAYIIESLYNSGGMERVISLKANCLVLKYNIDVTIITYIQKDRPAFYPLNEKVKRIDFGCNENVDKKHLKYILSKFLIKEHFDICISTYGRDFFFLPKIQDGSKKIIEFHFTYDINRIWETNDFRGKIIGKLRTLRMVHQAKKYDQIVVLTKSDELKWKKYSNKVSQIYNPLTIYSAGNSFLDTKIVIAVGRMDKLKGFDYLINCWAIVAKKHPDWKLNIFGGGDNTQYKQQIINKGLNGKIFLKGITSDISKEYLRSSLFVLSSRSEGFPLVMVEALSFGLPLVSFDCPSGPAELIIQGENGYLVKPVGNIEELANKICILIENDKLRKRMGEKSKEMSFNFSVNTVMNRWLNLYNKLLE